MPKLRFIKPWGPYKVGEILTTVSPYTVKALVETYKLAEIVEGEPAAPEPVILPPAIVLERSIEPEPVIEAPSDDVPYPARVNYGRIPSSKRPRKRSVNPSA